MSKEEASDSDQLEEGQKHGTMGFFSLVTYGRRVMHEVRNLFNRSLLF
jgi:hypothetical protein